jgi:surfeit locus 1 family protein
MSFWPKLRVKQLLVSMTIIAMCLCMSGLQLWRAETRGAKFEQQQLATKVAPVVLNDTPIDVAALQWRRVMVRGHWLPGSTLLLDNKIYLQKVGYHVLTALQLDDSKSVVLVNRGWVAAPRLRTEMPLVTAPSGQAQVTGIARKFEDKVFEFGQPVPEGLVWQHIREGEYRQRSGLDVLPLIVLQVDADGQRVDSLIRDWRDLMTPENPALRHYGYAIIWIIFALIAAFHGFVGLKQA